MVDAWSTHLTELNVRTYRVNYVVYSQKTGTTLLTFHPSCFNELRREVSLIHEIYVWHCQLLTTWRKQTTNLIELLSLGVVFESLGRLQARWGWGASTKADRVRVWGLRCGCCTTSAATDPHSCWLCASCTQQPQAKVLQTEQQTECECFSKISSLYSASHFDSISHK